MSREAAPNVNRIDGFDTLRFLMVMCVMLLHAAMTYMAYVPGWWYVKDTNDSFFFALLVVFLDSFPMTVLFLLSGYFAVPSLAKRGRARFIKDKFIHIGIPWLLGLVLIAPLFAHATLVALGFPSPGAAEFLLKYFIGPFYQQGQYWFLGVLFLFLLVYAFIAKPFTKGNSGEKSPSLSPNALIALIWAASAITYALSGLYVKPAVEWLNIGYLLYFQPARLVGYIGVFAMGVMAYKSDWFTSGWRPSTSFWGCAAVLSAATHLAFMFFVAPSRDANFNLVTEAIFYNSLAISMTLFLIQLFVNAKRSLNDAFRPLAGLSYGIYWLHMGVLMLAQYGLKPLEISIYAKWPLSIAITTALCWGISKYIFKKAPLLRDVF